MKYVPVRAALGLVGGSKEALGLLELVFAAVSFALSIRNLVVTFSPQMGDPLITLTTHLTSRLDDFTGSGLTIVREHHLSLIVEQVTLPELGRAACCPDVHRTLRQVG